jgi:hypothetical protein
MAKVKVSEILKEIADDSCWRYSATYSGRGMFGRNCLSIVSDQSSPVKIIEEAAAHGIFGASWDSMGMGVVVYWPAITGETEMDRMVLVDEDDINE